MRREILEENLVRLKTDFPQDTENWTLESVCDDNGFYISDGVGCPFTIFARPYAEMLILLNAHYDFLRYKRMINS